MKKYLLILVVAVVIIPQVTFASWWNPFSWGVFRRADIKTQVLENRIKELENKLGVTATSTSEIKEKESETISVLKKTETKEVVPIVNNTTKVKTKAKVVNVVTPPVTNVQTQKVRNLEQEYKEIVANYAKLKEDALLVKDRETAIDILKKISLDNEDLFRISTSQKTAKVIDFYEQRYSQLRANFNNEFPPSEVKSIIEEKATAKQVANANSKLNSPECISAKTAYNEIESKIATTKHYYLKKIEALEKIPGITTYGVQGQMAQIEREQSRELADLAIQEIPLMSKYYAVCEGYYGSPSSKVYPTYTPPVNTYCQKFGDNISCTSY